ncbi:MAG: DUF302 domain-containing protein [Calditrichia bacterium]
MKTTSYGFSKEVDYSFEQALDKVAAELKKEGFGILTEIDVKTTMKKKLDVDYKSYKILGACNPPFAHQALQAEEQIGLMLPCNVIVYINVEDRTVVAAVNPMASMQAVENPNLGDVAAQVQNKLKAVIERV